MAAPSDAERLKLVEGKVTVFQGEIDRPSCSHLLFKVNNYASGAIKKRQKKQKLFAFIIRPFFKIEHKV
jgi:hypothetical protein